MYFMLHQMHPPDVILMLAKEVAKLLQQLP